ncbi:MAG: D-glucuronyl C5-epimerase family protein [Actinomycetota bacterium]
MTGAAAGVAAAALALIPSHGLQHALKAHWLKPADVTHYRAVLYRAERDIRRLPKLRAQILERQLAQLAPRSDSYIRPRALALFSQLEVNCEYLETHRVPDERVDVPGDDGVVYRWFPNEGLEFHPLASFSALDNTPQPDLAQALVDRGIPRDGTLVWEYAFRFGSGHPPWTSGMAQAVAAQALARAGFDDAARRAYLAVPRLTMQTSAGPWIRLYSFTREVVLNAQLQTVVSLFDYGATGLASRMLTAAQTLFPRFDTGDWSRYELGGAYATRSYQEFVTTLLGKVASATQDPFWQTTAARFKAYLYSPPQVTQTTPPPTAWPVPADGFLDTVPVAFMLSQRASVTVAIAGVVNTYRMAAGAHVITWKPPATLPPGTYPVQVSAVTYAGNRSTAQLAPVVVAWDQAPPPVTATVADGTLSWQSTDAGTPSLQLAIDLVDPAGVQPPQTLDLGYHSVSGSAPVTLPPGTWQATLRAANSAGLTTSVDLGQLQG